ncbi:serine/threonine protein phosphatase PrpC [Actinomadura rupiterrae]|nr:serine/threonine protein phosphatase PrpC [Actinomadura rupiterrae]
MDCGAVAIDADGYCGRCGLRQPTGREHVEIALSGPDGLVACAGVSDVGRRRKRNEDSFALAVLPAAVCAVVCDGVATAPGSDEASRIAAETGTTVLAQGVAAGADPVAATRAALDRASEAVAALGEAGPSGAPACTYVSALVDAATVTVGWIGDSRAYWIPALRAREVLSQVTRSDLAQMRAGTVEFAPRRAEPGRVLTRDDSWAEQMIRTGAMTPEAAHADRRAHLLTGWLGADAGATASSVAGFAPDGPGAVLVCSDGLWNYLPEPSDLAAVLGRCPDPAEGVRVLLAAALEAGGRDNVTAVLIPFPPPDGLTAPTPGAHTAPATTQPAPAGAQAGPEGARAGAGVSEVGVGASEKEGRGSRGAGGASDLGGAPAASAGSATRWERRP